MEWKVRKAVKKDEAQIKELFIEMLQAIYSDWESIDGYEEGYLDRVFDDHEDWICVAEINRFIVAYLSIEVHREQGKFIYLDDLSVSEKYRGNGIGTGLIKTAEKFAEDMDISMIVLHVEKMNTSAFELYKRLGYSIMSEEGTRLRMKKSFKEGVRRL